MSLHTIPRSNTGVVGVYHEKDKYKAGFMINSIFKTKSFSISAYSEYGAFELAKLCRKEFEDAYYAGTIEEFCEEWSIEV